MYCTQPVSTLCVPWEPVGACVLSCCSCEVSSASARFAATSTRFWSAPLPKASLLLDLPPSSLRGDDSRRCFRAPFSPPVPPSSREINPAASAISFSALRKIPLSSSARVERTISRDARCRARRAEETAAAAPSSPVTTACLRCAERGLAP